MAVIGHSEPVQTGQSTCFGSVTIDSMRSSTILFLGFLTACAPDEPRAVDSPGWLKIQEFGPAVEIPRDGALRLEYGVTGARPCLMPMVMVTWTFCSQELVPNRPPDFGGKPIDLSSSMPQKRWI